jgi:hypothetical protein
LVAQEAREQALRQVEEFRSQLAATEGKRRLTKLRAAFVATRVVESPDAEVRQRAGELSATFDAKLQAVASAQPQSGGMARKYWYVGALAALAVLAAGIALLRQPKPKPAPVQPLVHTEQPLPPAVQVAGNLEGGAVYLDGAQVGDLTADSIDLKALAPGPHVLKVTSREGDASIELFQDAAAGPRIAGPIKTNHLAVTAVATNEQNAVLITSAREAQPVLVDGRSAGTTKAGLATLPAMQPGNHRVRIGTASDGLNLDLTVQPKPSLYVLLTGRAATGWLEVRANVPGFELVVDGKTYGAKNERDFRLLLPVKTYEVYATHDGYVRSDATQATIGKGSQTVVELRLTPKPAVLRSNWMGRS